MASFYDMTPEELDFFIKEGDYDADKASFLRNEWAKKNTLSGKAKASLESKTKLPEGFDRADFLPVSKPEDKSVIDAIKSGEANWAVPGALVDTADQVLTAGRTGEKMSAGLPISEDEQMQAAFTGAGVAAGGSSAFSVPEGSIRIFGGYKRANSPGYAKSGVDLPQSVGREGLKRFEIDDSEAVAIPNNLKSFSKTSQGNNVFSLLDDVLIHEELYYQYPELKNLRIGIDEDLTGTTTMGYHNPNKALIAVRKDLAEDPKKLKDILLHEIQHEIQDLEDFSKGTNRYASEITPKAKSLEALSKKQKEEYQKSLQENINTKSIDSLYTKLAHGYLDILEDKGYKSAELLDLRFNNETLTRKSNKDFRGLFALDSLLKEMEKSKTPDLYTGKSVIDNKEYTLGGVKYRVEKVIEYISAEHKDPATALSEMFDMPKEDFKYLFGNEDKIADKIVAKEFNLPEKPGFTDSYFKAYQLKAGETEARNVQSRKDFTLEERFKTPPETTEDYKRNEQWVESDYNFNEDEQMSMFDVKGFAEGGMATDPVSGNKIPPGSSAEEVRDDIDAKLSEGEYVVPADVVQYYGVKFFEKLREKAKSDLEEMASDGRIGGEPIEYDEEPEDDDEEELSPEEMAMLQEVMSQDSGNVEMQMAEGGLVPKADKNMQPTFDPKKWQSMGASLTESGASQSGSLYKTFVGPSGEVRMILFVNGKPVTPIPKGFTEKTAQPTQAKVEEPVYNNQADEGRDKREDREQPTDSKSWAERNYEALSTDPVKFGMEQLKGGLGEKLGPLGATMVAGPLAGGIVGSAMKVENIAAARAAEKIAQAQGIDTTPLTSAIKSAEENLDGFGKLAISTFNAGSGDSYYKEWEDVRSRDKGVTNSASRTPSTTGPRDETGSNGGGVYSPDSRPEGPSSKPEGGTGGAGVGGGPSTGPSKSDMQKDIGEQGGYRGGYGFKKGGLVTKRVKPAKNKGLVTKRK